MSIQRYSNKEPLVFAWIAFPYIVFMNLLIFGICVWGSWITFGLSTIISSIYFSIIYAIFGRVAVVIKNTYPGAGDMFKRISIMLPVFYLMNIFSVQGIFLLYDYTGWISCAVSSGMTGWTILYACVMSTLITFINEGMANWQNWKDSLSKAEKLRNAYQRSKLLGLKGQMNPHFLFNCFNTLSGLIQENADRADCFLNEMIRVHRYLLRSDDAFLVSLSDEINYAKSYLNLAKTRFGEALIVEFNVNSKYLNRMLPPLSMQVILENIIYANA
jgi:two-component system, LytTR family, sensor kinase